MSKKILFLLLLLITFTIFFPNHAFAQQGLQIGAPTEYRLEGVITNIPEQKQIEVNGQKQLYQKLQVTVTSDYKKGDTITIENGKIPLVNTQKYTVGDTLVITLSKDNQGKDMYYINDYVRRTPLYWLFAIFLILAVIIGGKRGLASIGGMIISFVIIFFYLLPQILSGSDPVITSIIASLFIIPATFYLSHGLDKKTTIAAIATVIALILTGLLASFFIDAARLTGFASEEAVFLQSAKQGAVNIRGLVLAGIIVGALGILDDITLSQAALVFQLKEAFPDIAFKKLYFKAMEMGEDHIASIVNTLVLVYTGAALPLLLLFINSARPFSEVINYEFIATEIIRTLVASIGLILAVPIVTLMATWIAIVTEKSKNPPTTNITSSKHLHS